MQWQWLNNAVANNSADDLRMGSQSSREEEIRRRGMRGSGFIQTSSMMNEWCRDSREESVLNRHRARGRFHFPSIVLLEGLEG
jgi:hypothetical protein